MHKSSLHEHRSNTKVLIVWIPVYNQRKGRWLNAKLINTDHIQLYFYRQTMPSRLLIKCLSSEIRVQISQGFKRSILIWKDPSQKTFRSRNQKHWIGHCPRSLSYLFGILLPLLTEKFWISLPGKGLLTFRLKCQATDRLITINHNVYYKYRNFLCDQNKTNMGDTLETQFRTENGSKELTGVLLPR